MTRRPQSDADHARDEKDWYDFASGKYGSEKREDGEIERILDGIIQTKSFSTMLELACGTGRFTDQSHASMVVGTDLSRLMLGRAKPTGADLVQADIWTLPFRAATFDGVTCMHALGEHIPLDPAMKEVWRVAAKESTFIFTTIPHRTRLSVLVKTMLWKLGRRTDYTLSRYQASREDVERMARSTGFVVMETTVVRSGLEHLLVVCRRKERVSQYMGDLPAQTRMQYYGAHLVGRTKLSQKILWRAVNRFPRAFYSLRRDWAVQDTRGGVLRLRSKNGKTMFILRDYAALFFTEHRKWDSDYLPKFSLQGLTVLDVGAGCGETALFFLSNGAKKVICVEPEPEAARVLSLNVRSQGWNVQVFERPLSLDILGLEYDFAKLDCEGGEVMLLDERVKDTGPCRIELHDFALSAKEREAIISKFGLEKIQGEDVWGKDTGHRQVGEIRATEV